MLDGIKNTLGTAGKALQAKQQQDRLKKLMSTVSATGYSKNNKVSVTLNGEQNIVGMKIESALINFVHESTTAKGQDDTMIAKCVMEAFEDAQKKIQPELMKKLQESGSMSDIMGMLGGM